MPTCAARVVSVSIAARLAPEAAWTPRFDVHSLARWRATNCDGGGEIRVIASPSLFEGAPTAVSLCLGR